MFSYFFRLFIKRLKRLFVGMLVERDGLHKAIPVQHTLHYKRPYDQTRLWD